MTHATNATKTKKTTKLADDSDNDGFEPVQTEEGLQDDAVCFVSLRIVIHHKYKFVGGSRSHHKQRGQRQGG